MSPSVESSNHTESIDSEMADFLEAKGRTKGKLDKDYQAMLDKYYANKNQAAGATLGRASACPGASSISRQLRDLGLTRLRCMDNVDVANMTPSSQSCSLIIAQNLGAHFGWLQYAAQPRPASVV